MNQPPGIPNSRIDGPEVTADDDASAFNVLFHGMPMAAMLTEASTSRVMDVNDAFRDMFGWPRNEIVGQLGSGFPLWISTEQRQQLIDAFELYGKIEQFEAILLCRDGHLKICRISMRSLVLDGTQCRLSIAQDASIDPLARPGTIGAELRESQERLNLALDASQMGTWDWNLDTGLLHCCARVAMLHGHSPVAWSGELSVYLRDIHPEDQRQLRRSFISICRNQLPRYRLAYRLKTEKGQPRWLEATAKLYRGPSGRIQRFVGTLVDITERRRNEQALIKSEAKFSALFQGAPDPYILVNANSHIVIEINRNFTEFFGYQPEDIVGRTTVEAGLWQDPAIRESFVTQIHQDYRLAGAEIDFLTLDGQVATCEVSCSFLTVNRQACVLSTFKDVTARKQAETALRASEEKFSRAFRASPDSISITEKATGRHLEINEGFTRLSGYSPAEVIGKTARELNIWADYNERAKLIEELDRNGRVMQHEMRVLGKDGHELLVSVSIEPIMINGVACMVLTARDITNQKLIEAKVKHLAYHDALTDLPNRLLLTDRLNQALALLTRHDLHGALLFFDLDHFKHINDSLGHSCGDSVLQEVTRRLRGRVRKEDTVARLGGDEFVVLLSGLQGEDTDVIDAVRRHAEALLLDIAAPMTVEGHSLQLSCSIGIAMLPEHGNNPEDLLKRADIALYKVKEAGRNGIAFFEQAMQKAASERLSIETDLRTALNMGQFRLFYQPQIDSRNDCIIGAEALIRWELPDKGIIGPASFIHVLEESGMIIAAGQWVLNEACSFAAQLINDNLVDPDHFSMSVNISPRQFRHPDFVTLVRQAIAEQGVPASSLKLEITENIVIQNISDTIAKMQELRKLGVCFAIDDFGTGYSSLSYLKQLPLDLLKIDQSFIRDCTQDSNDAEIVRAIIAMGRNLNLDLIAEGVETPEQLSFLQQQSCHAYQGYLFSPPVPAVHFVQMLQSHPKPQHNI
ncbi:EAL domain-containing protein [Halopseudomonas sp.]|uniref:bifunctional diguanylate cyclase/phosphodiesterase n=1 Tax=Halopseudomonas sp. TaxID=2901191 RepID=UPI003567E723